MSQHETVLTWAMSGSASFETNEARSPADVHLGLTDFGVSELVSSH